MAKRSEQKMSEEDRRALWKQYAGAHASAQKTFDTSVRTLAAAGVAVTVSLIAKIEDVSGWAAAAVIVFLLCLGVNLVSYVTAQLDVKKRMEAVKAGAWEGAVTTNWTTWTFRLNVAAGFSLFIAGCLLGIYVTSAV